MDKNDLTQGVIWKKLIMYFLPIAAGTLFQQLYNAVDAIVVGKYVGTAALAAVGGSASTIINLIINFFVALSGGASVIIAHLYGSKDYVNVKKASNTAVLFCIVVGAIVGIAIIFSAKDFLIMLKTPADTIEEATIYLKVYFSGTIFMLLFNMGSSILRAMGNSRLPFIYLIVSCITNIVLDLYFVIALNLAVVGVALATVIAQGLSAVLVMINLIVTDAPYGIEIRQLKIEKKLLSRMMNIGLPAGLQSSMYGISNMILQVGVNTLGTIVVASWAMSGKIDGVYWATSSAFGTAIMNFIGQNYGAGKTDRIKETLRTGFKIFFFITIFISIILLLVARPVLRVFTNDQAVIDTTWTIITYFVPFYFMWTIIETFSSALRGIGDAVKPMLITCVGICVIRIIWVYTAFFFFPTLFSISICYPITWVITDISLLVYYFKYSEMKANKVDNK